MHRDKLAIIWARRYVKHQLCGNVAVAQTVFQGAFTRLNRYSYGVFLGTTSEMIGVYSAVKLSAFV
jgi:hypothetical protein